MRAFDPQQDFTDSLMFEKNFNSSEKYFFRSIHFFWKYFWGFSRKKYLPDEIIFFHQKIFLMNIFSKVLNEKFDFWNFWFSKIWKNVFFEKTPKNIFKKMNRSKKYFSEELKFFSNIKESVKSCCGSNARTLSVRKSL